MRKFIITEEGLNQLIGQIIAETTEHALGMPEGSIEATPSSENAAILEEAIVEMVAAGVLVPHSTGH